MSTKYIVNNVTGQTINGEAVQRPYKVYTALLSQNGGSVILTTGNFSGGPSKDNDTIDKGRTYEITANPNNADLSAYGAPNNLVGTKFVSTYSANLSDDNLDVDVILTYNTGTPVVKVLENTIGEILFNFDSEGTYRISSNDLFTANKTYTNLQLWGDDSASPRHGIVLWGTASELMLLSTDLNGVLANVIGNSNNPAAILTSIEIRVYN